MNKKNLPTNQTNFLLYTGNDGKINIEVFLQDETIWLTQKAISELYGVQRPAITKHLKNIFDCGELQEDPVSSILEHAASDGKKYKTKFYNLDAIISVGLAHDILMTYSKKSGNSVPRKHQVGTMLGPCWH